MVDSDHELAEVVSAELWMESQTISQVVDSMVMVFFSCLKLMLMVMSCRNLFDPDSRRRIAKRLDRGNYGMFHRGM